MFLSPWIFGDCLYNGEGIFGVNAINLQMSIDTSAKRLFSTANNYTYNISLGTDSDSNPFHNTELLFNFLSTQPTQLVSSKSVLPFTDYSRYLSFSSTTTSFAYGQTTTLISNNLQLNQLPSKFIIFVRNSKTGLYEC